MKRMITTTALTVALLCTAASGAVLVPHATSVPLMKQGLYTAFDSLTGNEQVYYRPYRSRSSYQLTTTESDKSMPQWGQKGVSYYFYDRVDNVIVTCEGDLFYYLDTDLSDTSQLMMGCVDPASGFTDIVEGYPLSGFTESLGSVQEYYVASGTDLDYDQGGTGHDAYPLVVYSDDEESILLHDSEAHLGSSNYDDGFVAYYDDSGTGDLQTGLESSYDDNIGWNGSIACPRCQNHRPRNPTGDESADNESTGDTDSTHQNTDVESSQTTESDQSSSQTTEVDSQNQNSNGASAEQSQSSQNANDVNVTVNVNVTNTNTSSSESSSDFSGTVSSDSSASETAESVDPVDTAVETVSPSISADGDESADPLVGDFNLQGSGACSLNPSRSHRSQDVPMGIVLFSVMIVMRGLHARKIGTQRLV